MTHPRACALSLVLSALAACAGGRTTAATQPSPAAFDPAKSDPKAVAAVDAMMNALGGPGAWANVKQVQWDQRYLRDGKLMGWFKHSWDRWNGRHRFEEVNIQSLEKAQATGKNDEIKTTVAMYDLFDHQGKGFATFDGQQVATGDRDRIVDGAYKNWLADTYRLFAPYKAKDPGVMLAMEAPRQPQNGLCTPGCDVVKLTFAPEVGKDTWYLSINTQSHLPEILERDMPAAAGQQPGRLGFALKNWTQAGPIKVPGRLENLGMSEVFEVSGVKVGEPEDDLYIPNVTSTN
jgi:hypothetical protein